MIKIALETREMFAGQPNNMVISLMNNERETLTNIVFGLKLPATFTVKSGSRRVEISQLTPNERFKHTLVVIPKSRGTRTITLYNLSYRDSSGKTQRLKDFSQNITVLMALSPPEPAKIKSELLPNQFKLEQWGKLQGKLTNIGSMAVGNIKVKVGAPEQVETRQEFLLKRLSSGETQEFSISVRPLASGEVPIDLEITYVDQAKRGYRNTLSDFLHVVKNAESEISSTINYNQTFTGSVGGVQQGNNNTQTIEQNNYSSEEKQTLAEAASEIQKLLEQLSKTYPTQTLTQKAVVAEEVVKEIENNPTLKKRVVNTIKAMGIEILMQAINHPVANVLREGIEAFQDHSAN
ncbi:MAG: hypothetical protein QNJ33_04605 [Crocosphaera sp.]|nr:hypothetical protein [Crocosphaera sp.]